MPIRTKKRGSGITEEELQEFEFAGDLSAPISDRELAQWAAIMDEERILRARHMDWIHQASQSILATQRLPALYGYYQRSDKGWKRWEQSDEYVLEIIRVLRNPHAYAKQRFALKMQREPSYRSLEDIAEKEFGTDSNEHFAARIIGLMHQLRIARRENFQSEVECFIFTLGECYATWKFKHHAEDAWKIGQRVRSGGQKGANIAHGSAEVRDQLNVRMRHRFEDRVSQGSKKMEAYKRVAEEFKKSVSTVRRACSSRRG